MENMTLEFICRVGKITPISDIIFAKYQYFVWQIVSIKVNYIIYKIIAYLINV